MTGRKFYIPNLNLGPLLKLPYYEKEYIRSGGSVIPAAAVVVDQHQRVVGWNNQPILSLYATCNSIAQIAGAVIQSGISSKRGMTHAYLERRSPISHPCGLVKQDAEALGR